MKELPKNAGETREIDRRTILKGLGIGAATVAGVGAGLWLTRLNNGANNYTPGAVDSETTGASSDRETTANHELSGDSMKLSAEEREKITDDAKQSALAKVNELREQTPSDVFDDDDCEYASADYYSLEGISGLGRQSGEHLFVSTAEGFGGGTRFDVNYSIHELTANNGNKHKVTSLTFHTDNQFADRNRTSYAELVRTLTSDETTVLLEVGYGEIEDLYDSQGGYAGMEVVSGGATVKIYDDGMMKSEVDDYQTGVSEGKQAREAIATAIDRFK